MHTYKIDFDFDELSVHDSGFITASGYAELVYTSPKDFRIEKIHLGCAPSNYSEMSKADPFYNAVLCALLKREDSIVAQIEKEIGGREEYHKGFARQAAE